MASLFEVGTSYTRIFALTKGGMGEVEIALRREGDFKRLYAVKRLLPHYREDERVRAMFLAEARIAGLIRHPNVVSVLDVGEDESGPFLVMDFIEGVSVSALASRLRKRGERLPLQLVLRVIGDAARGLHAAHELCTFDGTPHPVVHRDVSPQNVLLGFDGVTRLTDFGVAKALGHLTQTDSGVLKGKAGYMSPEQLRFKEIDRRSDLFSLGVVMFELLTSRRLYVSEEKMSAQIRILEEPPPDVGDERADLPPELVELSFDLLSKEIELRPATAKDVAERLDAMRTPLEGEQGAISLAEYLTKHYAAEREAFNNKLAVALRDIEARAGRDRLQQGSSGHALDPIAKPTVGARLANVRSRLPRHLRWLGVVLFATLAGAIAIGFLLNADRFAQLGAPTRPSIEEDIVPANTQPRLRPVPDDSREVTGAGADHSASDGVPDAGVQMSEKWQTKRRRGSKRPAGARLRRPRENEHTTEAPQAPLKQAVKAPRDTSGVDEPRYKIRPPWWRE